MKEGRTLYAAKAGGRWFVKQASSPKQFAAMCIADERRSGYSVPPRSRQYYLPDFIWDDTAKVWTWSDGRPYGKRLPVGARR